MSKYKYTRDGNVREMATGKVIPAVEGNSDWDEYLLYDGTTEAYLTEVEAETKAWLTLRQERDRLLLATDFMMAHDYYNDKMTSQEQTDVATYREELRDLPDDTSDPHDVTWPTKPQIVIDNGI
jgi:hypothetical protein